MTRRRGQFANQLLQLSQRVAEQFAGAPAGSAPAELRQRIADQMAAAAQREMTPGQVAEAAGQMFVQARLVWSCADPRLRQIAAERDIFPAESELFGQLLRRIASRSSNCRAESRSWEPIEQLLGEVDRLRSQASLSGERGGDFIHPYDFDQWLAVHDRHLRARRGIFFTPPAIARYMMRRTDQLLRDQFGLRDGLADTASWNEVLGGTEARHTATGRESEPFVRIVDPAAGTGVFLVAALSAVHRSLQRRWGEEGRSDEERRLAWNDYVPGLLERLVGIELMLPTALFAWLRVAEQLARTGYIWEQPAQVNIVVGDSLAEPAAVFGGSVSPAGPMNSVEGLAEGSPWDRAGLFTVIVGNPPFAALTPGGNGWAEQLLKSRTLNGRPTGSYYEVDDRPLGEKKLWLHDDYVKFLRLAQWQIERSGGGVVALVTNHGYLDNLTFRGVRQSLGKTFPQIAVIDLHGNHKKRETGRRASPDKNVFDIGSGIAIGLFCRPSGESAQRVTHAELWGSRDQKLAALEDDTTQLAERTIQPLPPYYFFVPSQSSPEIAAEYERGFPLTEVMPIYGSAAVTARDKLVVAFTSDQLLDRLRAFSDPLQSDLAIQSAWLSTRSRRYAPGDTRGWKLSTAREATRRAEDLRPLIRPCQYRPFDRRVAVWADWLIDWPRPKLMRHMLEVNNLALVTRRQMLPDQPCNYFFITDTVVLDGLIRSDNRGNESFFPLWLAPQEDDGTKGGEANFGLAFLDACRRQWSLQWCGLADGDLETSIGARDLLALIYAQFHSEGYRDRYQHVLRLDFPRVFLPRTRELLRQLCELGRQLIAVHVNSPGANGAEASHPRLVWSAPDAAGERIAVLERLPRLDEQGLDLGNGCRIVGDLQAAWNYRVGGHQVCRQWLRARRGRQLSTGELDEFLRIIGSLQQTIQLAAAIERVITKSGGWPGAFVGR